MAALMKAIQGWELVIGVVGSAIVLEALSVIVWVLVLDAPGVPLIGGLVGAIVGIVVGRRLKQLNQSN